MQIRDAEAANVPELSRICFSARNPVPEPFRRCPGPVQRARQFAHPNFDAEIRRAGAAGVTELSLRGPGGVLEL